MASLMRLIGWVCGGVLLSLTAQAAPVQTHSFYQWQQDLEREAIADGVSPETAAEALDHALLDDRVLALDQRQPETTSTFEAYRHRIVNAERIAEGRKLLKKYDDLLDTISTRYGVSPQIIVALWGMESSFGHNSGDFKVVDSLMTLAYGGRRAEFFRKELLSSLHVLDQEHMSSSALRGSWAGAMGQCQFMPSTYLRYAVDEDGDGQRDIWGNRADVFASIANYIEAEGWSDTLTWGREVALTEAIPNAEVGLDHQLSLSEWGEKGVRTLEDGDLPNRPLQASLILPDGRHGRAFLVYDNFRALMRWNHSVYFALAVGLLADRMKE